MHFHLMVKSSPSIIASFWASWSIRLRLSLRRRLATLSESKLRPATFCAADSLAPARETPLPYLVRHAAGDWGDLDQDDKAENESALKDGHRILSAYRLADHTRIWIITEAD